MYYIRFDKEEKDAIEEFVSACNSGQLAKAFSDDRYIHFIVIYLPKNKDKTRNIMNDDKTRNIINDDIFCPKCGRETDPAGMFCQYCGYNVTDIKKEELSSGILGGLVKSFFGEST